MNPSSLANIIRGQLQRFPIHGYLHTPLAVSTTANRIVCRTTYYQLEVFAQICGPRVTNHITGRGLSFVQSGTIQVPLDGSRVLLANRPCAYVIACHPE